MTPDQSQMSVWVQREQIDRKADFLDSEGAIPEYGLVLVRQQN